MPLSRAILDAPVDQPPNAKCPDGYSDGMRRIEEVMTAERAWERLKWCIAARDGHQCRLCGKACRYGHADITKRADAHHIVFASAGGADESWNLLHLCRGCHDLIHVMRRFFLSGNADDRDELGRGMVKVERQIEGGFEVMGFI